MEEFLADRDKQNMTLFALLEAIQHCLDLGNHIYLEKGWGRPQTYRDVFLALWEHHLIDVSLRDQLVELAGFRNLLVHMYGKLDLEKVYKRLQSAPSSMKAFAKVVGELPEEESGHQP